MKKKHILIAEDDAFLVEMMQTVLLAHGSRVTVAKDGQEAIDAIDRDPPDLLLLDILMPRVDGFGVLQHLADQKLHLPVFVISNLSDKATKDKCKGFAITRYFVKSDIDDEQLWPIVEKYL